MNKLILNAKQMEKALKRVSKEIAKDGIDNVALVGIRTRGVPIAEWLAKGIKQIKGRSVPVGALDINLYRDDLSEVNEQPLVRPTELPFGITDKGIILVDDVLYTGRTIRAAMDALIDYGRPKFIKLMVVVDRGWRELPIQPDYVALNLETKLNENVKVMLEAIDGTNAVFIKAGC